MLFPSGGVYPRRLDSHRGNGRDQELMAEYIRSGELALPEESLVIVSDVQERLVAPIAERLKVIERCRFLLQGATLFEVPISVTEQYPQKLGSTVAELTEWVTAPPAKLRFSCVEALQLPAVGDRTDGRRRAVLIGIETHVCIQQTAFDLQALGYEVILPVDALASQRVSDHEVALRRMENAGMTLTTTQSLLFEWCQTAEHPQFKALSNLITGRSG